MTSLKSLRLLIILMWLTYFLQVLSLQVYDPHLHSPMLRVTGMIVTVAMNQPFFYHLMTLETLFWIVASAALWLGQRMGRWAFTGYLILALMSNYFIRVEAASWSDNILEDVSFLLAGIVLCVLYASPLSAWLKAKKTFPVLKFLVAFAVFFVLFFGVPIGLSYLMV